MSLDKPHVVVIGAGAIGGLFGGLMAEQGLPVTLVDTSAEHVAAINSHGLKIVGVGGDRQVKVRATTGAADVSAADIVIFQCKAFHNQLAAESARHLIEGGGVAITFQNGLGNEEALGRVLGPANVIAGLTAQGGLLVAPGVVRNFGDLPTLIGELAGGPSERCDRIAKVFTAHGLATTASANIKRDKWKKLLGNVSLGAISALTDQTSAEIMQVPELRDIVFRLLDEALSVAKAEGIALDSGEARATMQKLVDTTGGGTGNAKSSMREDIIRHRQTEIDTIHGAVARLARKHAVATPTLDAMIACVKGVQSTYLKPALSTP